MVIAPELLPSESPVVILTAPDGPVTALPEEAATAPEDTGDEAEVKDASPLWAVALPPLRKVTDPPSISRAPALTVTLPSVDSTTTGPGADPIVTAPTAPVGEVPDSIEIAPGRVASPVVSVMSPLLVFAEPVDTETVPLDPDTLAPDASAIAPLSPLTEDPVTMSTLPPLLFALELPAVISTLPAAARSLSETPAEKVRLPLLPEAATPACTTTDPPEPVWPDPATRSMLPPLAPAPLLMRTEPPTLPELTLLEAMSPAEMVTSAPDGWPAALRPATSDTLPAAPSELSPVLRVTDPEGPLVVAPEDSSTDPELVAVDTVENDAVPTLVIFTVPMLAASGATPELISSEPPTTPFPAERLTSPPVPRSLLAALMDTEPLVPLALAPA
jgi:hypothetical protein